MSNIVLISLYDEFCLGPRYISSALKKAGHQVDLVLFKHVHAADETPSEKADPDDYLEHFYASKAEIQHLQDFVKEREPLWVGFSFASVSSGLAMELTRRVREVTSAPIVWGGVDTTVNPECVWGGVDTTVNPEWAIEHADIICIGEGEYPAIELTEALLGRRDLDVIQNLWIRKENKVIQNPIRSLRQPSLRGFRSREHLAY